MTIANLDRIPSQSEDQATAASHDSNSVEAKAKLIEEGRAFFCSELVIKAFKVCGILQPTSEACSNFLPGDLHSAKDKLRLV